MKTLKYIGITLALALTLNACDQEIAELENPTPPTAEPDCPAGASAGSADFSKFVTLGNSLTAGFQAGALFTEGQNNSLGKILATQFACVGGGAFNQPDINSQNGFFTGGTNPIPGDIVLGRLLLQGTPPAPAPTMSDAGAIPNPQVNPGFMYAGDKDALNNFAVPGIQIGQIYLTETGNWGDPAHPAFNPFYARFAKVPGTSTIIGEATAALANGGTFFSFWLGNNDVLGYAVGGASNPAIFTSVEDFNVRFNGAISTLLGAGAEIKGIVGNIPDVTAIPYFRLVAYNAIPLPAENAAALNAGFAGYNQVLDALKGAPFNFPAADMDARKIAFAAGQNSPVIFDETLTDLGPYFDGLQGAGAISPVQRAQLEPYRMVRQTTNTDLLTLSAAPVLGTIVDENPLLVRGLTVPLGDQYVLIPQEQTEIRERTTAFNNIIAATANGSDRVALADVNAKFTQLATSGFESVNGVTFTPSLAPPTGGFSEDGVHPNSRGMAYVANIFIDAINAEFGASVPKVNIAKYQGTALPVNP